MAVVLAVAAVAMLVVSVALGPDQPSPWLRAVYLIAQWTGPLLLAALVCVVAMRKVVRWGERVLVKLAGPALIKAMSPRTVLGALLSRVYGTVIGHEDVLTGVLGGAGRSQAGHDTAVSRSTTAQFKLHAIDDTMCASEATWTHEYSGVQRNHKFVVFATCDPTIASLIVRERVYPLFELWQLQDEEQLEEFVPNLRRSFRLGLTYTERSGQICEVPPQKLDGEEVALHGYDELVRLPSSVDRKDLRIVEFDLWDLADPDHIIESIEQVSIRATTVHRIDIGFITWSPPHPCYVTDVVFDVAELAPDGQEFVYLVVPFTMKQTAISISGQWVRVLDRLQVRLHSWMLPGHGITLLWRPLAGAEERNASVPS